ncbi:sodium:calcium antiporter [Aliiroseovarius zhejiangensis]|uniref:Sodium:calcium antiporter n=1 Tax=Aliiroseovarius zhejiangensis TaxID=1632025 RepID=A0ABQ3IUT5_9RHOB|nr:calcium/sodium antiporter [Aliiroseovarius zhejiangensis]GHE92302.1 sodium:calcium antiporter [Aliiroseovarius zhejiangensis]
MDYLFVAAGLLALFFGGEALVRGSVGLANRLGIPPLLIGLTVVGFGTSTPELLVSMDAALRGVPDIAIGNVIGSNIANILLILGLTCLIWPIQVSGSTLRRDVTVMMIATLLLLPIFAFAEISRVSGALLVTGLIGYLTWAYLAAGKTPTSPDTMVTSPTAFASALWLLGGLAVLLLGARFLVDGAASIARGFGVSEAFIGLTIVAIGTSLPEMTTSVIAAMRRQSDIAIGNVIGSNIFNLLGILGVTAMITPIPLARRFASFDLPILIAVTASLAAALLLRPRLGRWLGVVMLTGYAAYVVTALG